MVERAEVEELLAKLTPREELLCELCRTWLAVADAPEGKVTSFDCAGAWMVDKDDRRGIYAKLRGQRVRLVPTSGAES